MIDTSYDTNASSMSVHFRFTNSLLCLVLVALLFGEAGLLEGNDSDWPRFRGADGSGRIPVREFPAEWSADENVAWTAKIPGAGWSSPISTAGKVFVTTAVFDQQAGPKGFRGGVSSMRTYRQDGEKNRRQTSFELHCLDLATGQKLWQRQIVRKTPSFIIHPSNTYATESPATDGSLVFAYFGAAGTVAAFTLDGKPVWSREIGRFESGNGFGSGSSLAVDGSRVIVQFDNDGESFIAALDAQTGRDVWRSPRESRTSWSSPVVWNSSGGTVIVSCSAGMITGHNPKNGKAVWKVTEFDGSFSSSPAVTEDHIFFGNSGPGSRGPLAAVSALAKGTLPLTLGQGDSWITWTRAGSGPGLSSPVAHEGLLYVTGGNGILSCYQTADGELVYKERLPGAASVAASLWIAGDHLFAMDESGKTFVVPTGRDFEVTGTNQLKGLFWSTPAVVKGALLIRSAEAIHCIRSQSKSLSNL
jgi:outer membrane protein assembly factor BamB